MQAKYEEKTFESYFNTELDQRTSIYFPFGQVQEGSIGADSAALSKSRWLWRLLGVPFWFRRPFSGVDLREVAAEMEHYLQNEIRSMPSIKVNLLFQYKRPEIITTANGSEWSYWQQRYFRYGIYAEQQDLLLRLDAVFGRQALILYASPAIADVNELVKAKLDRTIIKNTNFCRATALRGHHRNTYIHAGLYSIACSKPEEISSIDLLVDLKQFESNQSEANNLEIVQSFSKTVRGIVAEDAYLGKSYQAALNSFVDRGLEQYELLFSFISMSVFRDLSGTQWLMSVGDK